MYIFSGLFNAKQAFKQRLNMSWNGKEEIEELARDLRLQLRTFHTNFKDFEKEYLGLSVMFILVNMNIIKEDENEEMINYTSLTKEEKLEINKYYLIKSQELYKFLGEYIKEEVQRRSSKKSKRKEIKGTML